MRHLASGMMATVNAYSARGAAEQYAATIKYRQLIKEHEKLKGKEARDIEVKERDSSDGWSLYRVK